MSAQGTVRYQVILDDAQATQTLNKFKTNLATALAPTPFKALEQAFPGITAQFNKLQASVQNLEKLKTEATAAAGSVNKLGKEVQTTGTNVGTLTKTVDTGAKSLDKMDKSAKTAGDRLKSGFGKASGAMTGLSAAAANFTQLERNVRDYGDAQIAVDRTTRRLSLANEAVEKTQVKYNEAIKTYGRDSKEAKQALLDYNQAQEQARIQTQLVGEATEAMRDIQQSMWISGAGAIMGGIGGITDALKAFGGEKGLGGLATKMKGIVPAIRGFGGVMRSMLPFLAAAAGPIGIIVAGIAVLGRAWAGSLQSGNKFTTAVHELGLELEKIPIIGPALKIFGQIMNQIFLPDMVDKNTEAVKNNTTATKKLGTETKAVTTTAVKYISSQEDVLNSVDDVRRAQDALATAEGIGNRVSVEAAQLNLNRAKILALVAGARTKVVQGINLESDTVERNSQVWDENNNNTKTVPTNLLNVAKATGTVTKETEYHSEILGEVIAASNKRNLAVQAEVENLSGLKSSLFAVQEATGSYIHVGVNYLGNLVDLGKAEKFNRLSVEEKSATIQAAIKIQDDYNKSYEDGLEMMKKHQAESREATDQQNLLNEAFGTHIKVGTIDADVETKLSDTIKGVKTALDDEEIGLVKVLAQHKLLNPEIRKTIGNNVDNRNELNQAIITGVKWTDALDGQVNGLDLVASGTAKAVTEMEAFVTSAVENEAKTKAMNVMYEKLGNTMIDDLVKGMKLTVGQAQELGKSFGGSTLDNLKKVSDMIEEHVVASFEKLGSAFDALTSKDFKKGLKELNLGDLLGKDFERDVKNMKGDILDFNNTIADMTTQFAALDALGGKVSGGAFTKGVNALVDNFEHLAESDPELSGDKIQALFTKIRSMSPAELQKHAASISGLILAAKSGKDVNPAEMKAFIELFGLEEVSNIGTAADNTKKLGTETGAATGPMGAFNKAMLDSAQAYVYFNDQLVKNPLTVSADGSGATETMTGVQEWWKKIGGNIQGLVPALKANNKEALDVMKSTQVNWKGYANKISKIIPKITVNNKSALDGIKAVQDAMAKIKDKTVTIHQVTTGSFAKGGIMPDTSLISAAKGRVFTTQGPHAVMVGDNPGGRETVAAIPHNNPEPILSQLMGMFQNVSPMPAYKMASGSGKDMVINLYNVNNDRETMRSFKAGMGRDTYKFGG